MPRVTATSSTLRMSMDTFGVGLGRSKHAVILVWRKQWDLAFYLWVLAAFLRAKKTTFIGSPWSSSGVECRWDERVSVVGMRSLHISIPHNIPAGDSPPPRSNLCTCAEIAALAKIRVFLDNRVPAVSRSGVLVRGASPPPGQRSGRQCISSFPPEAAFRKGPPGPACCAVRAAGAVHHTVRSALCRAAHGGAIETWPPQSDP
eukprot:gene3256-biopygen15734